MDKPQYNREEFLLALGATIAVIVLFVWAFWLIGLFESIALGGYLGLGGTAIAIVVKMLVADQGLTKFELHKHGFDMCIMALGTSFATLAAEFASGDVPGSKSRIGFLLILALVALLGTLIAGGNTRSIETNTTRKPGALKAVNMLFGVVALGLNLVFIVFKSQPIPTPDQLKTTQILERRIEGEQ